jgi:hypothetical protein
MKLSNSRRAMALPVIRSCRVCHWYESCGGYHDTPSLYGESCFARFCCGGKKKCNYLCPSNARFVAMMNELEGLDFDGLPLLTQRRTDLPMYMPVIANNSCRMIPLKVPFAAVPVESVFVARGQHLQAVATTPNGLRDHLGLARESRLILNCIRQDKKIERLWEYWLQDNLPVQLATLGIDLVIAPNYSHLRGVPRLESVGNRMRHLICVRDLNTAGLNTVPHLSVVDPPDWKWWGEYLKRNPAIQYIAFEFETGYKNHTEGADAICRLADFQQYVSRQLHLIVVGGRQYRAEVRAGFSDFTFIDSAPFSNTIYRHRCQTPNDQLVWESSQTAPGEPLDELLGHNVRVYSKWFTNRLINGG